MSQKAELRVLVSGFAREMREKLISKADAGWAGWDAENTPDYVLEEKLLSHVSRAMRDPNQWVDVANFAAFLWWRNR